MIFYISNKYSILRTKNRGKKKKINLIGSATDQIIELAIAKTYLSVQRWSTDGWNLKQSFSFQAIPISAKSEK